MFYQQGLCLVEDGLALDGEFGVVKPGTDPSAYEIPAVIGNSGTQKCQRQHLRQGRNALRVKHGTNAEQYGAGDKKSDAEACFEKRDSWHNEQRILLVIFYPLQGYFADDMCLAVRTKSMLALLVR